jgi:hypothetical protein
MTLRAEWFDETCTVCTAVGPGVRVGEGRVSEGNAALVFSNGEQAAVIEGDRGKLLSMLAEAMEGLSWRVSA